MCTSICIIWKSMIKSMIELQNLTVKAWYGRRVIYLILLIQPHMSDIMRMFFVKISKVCVLIVIFE